MYQGRSRATRTATRSPSKACCHRRFNHWHRPPLYPRQRLAIYDPARFVIVEASTKSGKTVGCMSWLLELALATGKPGRNYLWVAPIYAVAKIAYRRMKAGLPDGSYVSNDTEQSLTLLVNGARLVFKGGDNPDSLYGEDYYAAVVDEASRCKEGIWPAVRSTLTATGAPARIIGNVRGKKNWAYRLARRAKDGGMLGWSYHRLTALDAIAGGVFSAAELESARAELPEVVFAELYMADAQDDDTNPFGIQAIRACVRAGLSGAEPVAWGWDLGKRSSWTVGIGLDADGQVARFVRFRRSWKDTPVQIVAETGSAVAFIDSTGVGDPVMERIAESGDHLQGFKFTGPSKQQLMENLAVGIQNLELGIPEGLIVTELEDMEYSYTRAGGIRYSAPEGLHDDCVMALALGKRALDTIPRVYPSAATRVTKGWTKG